MVPSRPTIYLITIDRSNQFEGCNRKKAALKQHLSFLKKKVYSAQITQINLALAQSLYFFTPPIEGK